MKDINGSTWFKISAVFAFAAIIAFFNVNSAFADDHSYGTAFIVGGVILTILSGISMYMSSNKSS